MSDKDWWAHHVEFQLYIHHQHNIRGIPIQTDQKIVRETGRNFCMGHTHGNVLLSQIALNDYYQEDIYDPKLPFNKSVKKS